MKWFKDYTDYEKLWYLGDIGIEDVPDEYLFSYGRCAHRRLARPSFDFFTACEKQMKARREARDSQ